MDAEKQEFLREFGNDYGYPDGPKTVDQIRATEFKRLDGMIYLDHAGATLYSEVQMEAIFKDFASNVYGNPHSQSESSMATTNAIRECRQQVLDYCNASAKEYSCVFTSGATAALKMIGEAFPWSRKSHFMYTMENHNSVVGIREYALSRGAEVSAVNVEFIDCGAFSHENEIPMKIHFHSLERRRTMPLEEDSSEYPCHLFAFPSECNFSGLKLDLNLVRRVKEFSGESFEGSTFPKGCCFVLIDAAKGCATDPPDLSKYKVDFVVISFYKLFGYPTGLGALLVRNEAAKLLKKSYFSGGTVAASIADVDFVKQRERIEEMFEDGTASFLSIASIRHGFTILNTLKPSRILRHTTSLASYLRRKFASLKHGNGAEFCVLYGAESSEVSSEMGPIVSFNLKQSDGEWIGYHEVEKLASSSGFQLRTGCFCNPGACAKYLGLSHLDLLSNAEDGHVCWDDHDVINGKPTGAVRVSFGYMSTFEETKKFVDFIVNSFLVSPISNGNGCCLSKYNVFPTKDDSTRCPRNSAHLKSITIYPVKSCKGFSVESWPLSSTGLLHDREWLLQSPSGEILSQKKVPEMSLVSTSIDLDRRILIVESPRCKAKLLIGLDSESFCGVKEEVYLHSQRYEVQCYKEEVDNWFSNAIARPCMLLKCSTSKYFSDKKSQSLCRDVEAKLNFVNEAQILLISDPSVSDLNSRLCSKDAQGSSVQVSAMRFRPNLVISGGEPYAEDGWKHLRIGNAYFTSLGGCNRCQMINIDQQGGQFQKSKEPLATLASYRRIKGRIYFGILLRYESGCGTRREGDSWLKVGQEVHCRSELAYNNHLGKDHTA